MDGAVGQLSEAPDVGPPVLVAGGDRRLGEVVGVRDLLVAGGEERV
jgi:hypothetical protein